MKPNLTSDIFLHNIIKKNNQVLTNKKIILNTLFFNFIYFTFLLLILLFLIYLYNDKKIRKKIEAQMKKKKNKKIKE